MTRTRIGISLGALLVVTVGWVGCADEDPLRGVAEGCVLSSECTSPLVCAFARCHQACQATRDCPDGQRCVQADKPYAVCQLPFEATCVRNSDCPDGQTCAVDAVCRNPCFTSRDCLEGQVCAQGTCAEGAEVVDGRLPDAPPGGAGERCIVATDCPGDLVCLRGGVCGIECYAEKDCPRTWRCASSRPDGGGRCLPPGEDAGGEIDGGVDGGVDGGLEPRATALAVVSGPGAYHTCAVLIDDSVKCWGANDDGQLGIGDTTNRGTSAATMGAALPSVDLGAGRRAVMVAATRSETCAVLFDGALKCWGAAWGAGAAPSTMGDALSSIDFGLGPRARAAAPADGATIALFDDDSVSLVEHLPGAPVKSLFGAGQGAAVAAGVEHGCVLLRDERLRCSGRNDMGQLGVGDTLDRNIKSVAEAPEIDLGAGRTAVSVSAGERHSCAVLDDGAVKCWGANDDGQLGVGDTNARGAAPGTMGDALPTVDLGAGRTARAVAAGGAHTCALLDDWTVKCWGYNGSGELGVGDTNARGAAPGTMGDALPAIDFGPGRTATAIAAGATHTCALLDDGFIKCWGDNADGQLGLGNTAPRGTVPSSMGAALPVVDLGPQPFIPTPISAPRRLTKSWRIER